MLSQQSFFKNYRNSTFLGFFFKSKYLFLYITITQNYLKKVLGLKILNIMKKLIIYFADSAKFCPKIFDNSLILNLWWQAFGVRQLNKKFLCTLKTI